MCYYCTIYLLAGGMIPPSDLELTALADYTCRASLDFDGET
jgi:hypothetical protein